MNADNEASSPRIDRLTRELASDQGSAVMRFWEEVAARGTPLVEAPDAAAGASGETLLTFVWRLPTQR